MKFAIVLLLVSSNLFAKTYLPDCKNGEQVRHTYYTLCYDENHEVAAWTAHDLTVKSISGIQKRTNNFREDFKVPTGSATLEDYKYSGFDRGHLVPAGDMKLNRSAMSDTFYMSNMAPQTPGFNRGVWRRIENLTRRWAQKYNGVFVITGAVLENGLPVIGRGVSIPRYFYKIVFDNHSKKSKMMAFLIENESSSKSLREHVVSVDEVERATGIDFFHKMDRSTQSKLEATVDTKAWSGL